MRERSYKIYVSIPKTDGTVEVQERIIKESELKRQHKDLILGQLIRDYQESPDDVQIRFKEILSRNIQVKFKDDQKINIRKNEE